MSAPCLINPHGYSSSTCGYCSPSASQSKGPTSKKYGLQAPQMTPKFYQDLIDRGWRRSGDYVYHPDMGKTCCPQYTIRLDAPAFKATKKHRQVINRWNRYLSTGQKPGEAEKQADKADKGKGGTKDKGKANALSKGNDHDYVSELRQFEIGYGEEGKHRFETHLVPARATAETFELYKRYQVAVHKDKEDSVSMRGFSRFLCDSPLADTTIKYTKGAKIDRLPDKYGSYHLLYRVDTQLVGISVIDVLPSCVSSVYFIWDPDWAWASLGKLSALREISLAKDLAVAGAEGMGFIYMGYWIANCVKMRYKSEYSPSFLLDPGTNVFHPLTPSLDRFLQSHCQGYYPFRDIEPEIDPRSTASKPQAVGDDLDEEMDDIEQLDPFPKTPIPGFADPSSYAEKEVDGWMVYMRAAGPEGGLVTVQDLEFRNAPVVRGELRECVAAVGQHLMAKKGRGIEAIKDKGIFYFG